MRVVEKLCGQDPRLGAGLHGDAAAQHPVALRGGDGIAAGRAVGVLAFGSLGAVAEIPGPFTLPGDGRRHRQRVRRLVRIPAQPRIDPDIGIDVHIVVVGHLHPFRDRVEIVGELAEPDVGVIGSQVDERAGHDHVAGIGRPFRVPHAAIAAAPQRLEAGRDQPDITAAAVGLVERDLAVAAVHDGDQIRIVGGDVAVAAGAIVLAVHLARAGIEHAGIGPGKLTHRAGAVGRKGEAVLQAARVHPLLDLGLVELEAIDEIAVVAARIARIHPFDARRRVAPRPLRKAIAQHAAVLTIPVHTMHPQLPVRLRAVDHTTTAWRNERIDDIAFGDQLALAFASRIESHDRKADAAVDIGLVGLPLLVAEPDDARLGAGEFADLRGKVSRGGGGAPTQGRQQRDERQHGGITVHCLHVSFSCVHVFLWFVRCVPRQFIPPPPRASGQSSRAKNPAAARSPAHRDR